ncbi:CPBP family intramembrane glutamic endopeptidase [Tenacibaculum jejuense]|uniref:Abortive phage infection protein (CAAX terminal protease) n=1 Tax=Tenacibaculum jejuense TaxID=584609 RepID=A0A238U5P3_9FLAO|nr:type II CAAX endopeptidase family protein [Tenacibaculum jejuense]SNR14529.1 Abortive phage infection protein (CAAX terminal protease) [Tenacibaculum jejuense]
MNISLFKSKLLPILSIIFLFIFWKLPLNIEYFEIIIATLFVFLVSYIEFKSKFLKSLGFNTKDFKLNNLLIKAPLYAIGLFTLYYFVLLPGVTYLTKQPIDFSDFDSIKNNPSLLIISLVFVWISAAFGEEIVWRGYFMKQFVKLFGEGKLSLTLNILLFGFLFGMLHSYQRITGQIVTGILGAILSFIFYKHKYNLWLNIAIHGFFDTIALLLLYFEFL